MSDTSNNKPDSGSRQDHLRESLSALMDGEANELEMHRILDRLGSDEELRSAAVSYQRIGAAVRQEQNAFSGIDLSASIRDAIAGEPTPVLESEASEQKQAANRQGWFANLGRLAVAASVAAATVVGVQSWQLANRGDAGAPSTELATIVEPVSVPSVGLPSGNLPSSDMFGARGLQAGFGTEQNSMTPEQMSRARGYADQVAQARFRAYMMEHAEQASAYGGSIVPLVRATSYGSAGR
ncbi:sigma-E factor negative regulatory protein [Parendozoicomonas haliclonae]|uniref:Sigma factor AlgU negative regulatory protein n=1 Tax=Parendozoicomonas haliclonae TaxID=1960125 RepID=A0A1X7AQS3_9GAMM|nr:sigma-E factor negative regulatory protein [Parendozoicomonas haliclonae]SMA50448.1 Sigma factor AlgU negative regulatory protein [Parendozoicomonas haliclonae]